MSIQTTKFQLLFGKIKNKFKPQVKNNKANYLLQTSFATGYFNGTELWTQSEIRIFCRIPLVSAPEVTSRIERDIASILPGFRQWQKTLRKFYIF